jgi:Holliday junction resolvase
MRHAAKIDANQTAVVAALRQAGAVVHSLAAVGKGMPDLMVLMRGTTMLMEVKDGAKVKSKQKLTPAQIEFHRTWTGGPLSVVDSPEAALRAIGVVK